MQVNADLHIHGRYSISVSKNMTLRNLAIESRRKGIQLLGTGDCLHGGWWKEIHDLGQVDDGTFELEGTRFVLTTEVEDARRVHHIIIFPSKDATQGFKEKVKGSSKNLETSGRPNIAMSGEEIAQLAKDADGLIGPSHAFTPWTSLYAYYDELKGSYGDMVDYVSFIELGLSADTQLADRIQELAKLTFLTNSDAHAPIPNRLAREFNRFEMDHLTFGGLRKAMLRRGGCRSILNVGFPPQEGKYFETACTRCFTHFQLTEALMKKWRCRCGGRIKKGVRDRIEELADYPLPRHPDHRPKYIHIIPLAEIIARALRVSSPSSKKVSREWNKLIERFGDEVKVLIDAPIEEIKDIAPETVTNAILMFREGRIRVRPGGGGQYGKIILPGMDGAEVGIDLSQVECSSPDEADGLRLKKAGQRSMFDY